MSRLCGTVIRIDAGGYHVDTLQAVLRCSVRGRLKKKRRTTKKPVTVGDRVWIQLSNPHQGVIESVEPRRTKLSRPASGRGDLEHILVANIDQVLVVSASQDPPFRSGLVDRMLAAAEKNGLQGSICLNKIDLADETEWTQRLAAYARIGYPVLLTSAVKRIGLDRLAALLKDKTTVLAGHSGAGKSSLLSAIQPGLSLQTGKISQRTGKGCHTTTSVSLLKLDMGGYVVDTPGIRSFGLWDIDPEDLSDCFPEMRILRPECRFSRCTHTHEPDCSVQAGVAEGRIDPERYDNYVRMLTSLREETDASR